MLISCADRKDGPYAGHGIIPSIGETWDPTWRSKDTENDDDEIV